MSDILAHPATNGILDIDLAGDHLIVILGITILIIRFGADVVVVFHGHDHSTGYRRWKGLNVFNAPAVQRRVGEFLVVRIADGKMVVGWWNWKQKRWTRVETLAVSGAGT